MLNTIQVNTVKLHTVKFKSAVLAAAVVFLLSACASSPRDQKDMIERAYPEGTPVVQPVRSVTSFSESLACMDDMLDKLGRPTVLITSKQFPDASNKSGTAVRELVITALSEMSRKSNAFRFIDFEVDLTRQDTVQYLSSLMLGMNTLDLSPPDIYVSGAVSYIDQNIVARRRGIGVSADGTIKGKELGFDLGYDSDINTSVIALEMHLGDMKTRSLFPGIHASNSALVAKGGGGLDGGGVIMKLGVQFNLSRDHSQGTGIALRTLVELGTIELIGKWMQLPYWQCVQLNQSSPEFQRELFKWFSATSPGQQSALFRAGLERAGYFADSAEQLNDPVIFKEAIARFQADQQLPPTGIINFAAYEKLIGRLVAVNAQGQFVERGWLRELHDMPLGGSNGLPGPIGVRVRTANGATDFAVGQALAVRLNVERSAFVRCYYQDSGGAVSQVYPNPLQLAPQLHARRTTVIPEGGGFTLRFDKPGSERVSCYASHVDAFKRLPPAMQGAPLEPIVGLANLDGLDVAMRALGTGQVSSSDLRLMVAPAAGSARSPRLMRPPRSAP